MFLVVCYLCFAYKYCGSGGRTSYGLFTHGFMSSELLALPSFLSINKCIVLCSKSSKTNGMSELKPFKTKAFYMKSQSNKTTPKLTFKKLLLQSKKMSPILLYNLHFKNRLPHKRHSINNSTSFSFPCLLNFEATGGFPRDHHLCPYPHPHLASPIGSPQ